MDLFERVVLCASAVGILEKLKIQHEELGIDFKKVLLSWIKITYKNNEEVSKCQK